MSDSTRSNATDAKERKLVVDECKVFWAKHKDELVWKRTGKEHWDKHNQLLVVLSDGEWRFIHEIREYFTTPPPGWKKPPKEHREIAANLESMLRNYEKQGYLTSTRADAVFECPDK